VGLLPCRGDDATSAVPESYWYLTGLIQQMPTMFAQGSISYRGIPARADNVKESPYVLMTGGGYQSELAGY
jgi:hypothetical protein